jgi:ABC-2 type transport system permease protein
MIGQVLLVTQLVVKDWQVFLADRKSAVLALLVPVLLASVFGLVFYQSGQRLHEVKLNLLIVNDDPHPLTARLVQELLHHARLNAQLTDRAGAEAAVAEAGPVALVIPAGFAEAVRGRPLRAIEGEETASDEALANSPRPKPDRPARDQPDRPSVGLLFHPLSNIEAQWAEGVFTEVVMRGLAQEMLAPLLSMLGKPKLERPFEMRRLTTPQHNCGHFDALSHSFCGMALQYLLFWGMESGLLLLRERQRGLWQRLRATPTPLNALILGKVLATASIALVQLSIVFAFGHVVFGVQVTGCWAALVLLACVVSLLASAIGLAVATLGGTEGRARSLCILTILSLAMLGGLWLPGFLMPAWTQTVAQGLPTTWAMRAMEGLTWQRAADAEVARQLVVVSAFVVGLLALSSWRLVRMEGRERRGMSI